MIFLTPNSRVLTHLKGIFVFGGKISFVMFLNWQSCKITLTITMSQDFFPMDVDFLLIIFIPLRLRIHNLHQIISTVNVSLCVLIIHHLNP